MSRESQRLTLDTAAFRVGPLGFELDVLRPDDLLVLRFQFVNLHPDPARSARLVRIGPAAEALVVVAFQRQDVQEQAFFVAWTEPLGFSPVVAVAARESRLAFRVPADRDDVPLTLGALLGPERLGAELGGERAPRHLRRPTRSRRGPGRPSPG